MTDKPTTVFEYPIEIRQRDVDQFDRVTPGALYGFMQDAALALGRVEEHGEQVVQAPRRQRGGHLERAVGEDVDALVEEAVAPHAVAVEGAHPVRDAEGGISRGKSKRTK